MDQTFIKKKINQKPVMFDKSQKPEKHPNLKPTTFSVVD